MYRRPCTASSWSRKARVMRSHHGDIECEKAIYEAIHVYRPLFVKIHFQKVEIVKFQRKCC